MAVWAAAVGLAFGVWALWGAGGEASGWSLVLMLTGLPVWWWGWRSVGALETNPNVPSP